MYCRNCGKETDDNAVICPHCGVRTYLGETFVRERISVEESNDMAIAGFVDSFFMPVLGLVFGGIGLSRAKRRKGKGKGLSVAAIVISIVSFFGYLSLALLCFLVWLAV